MLASLGPRGRLSCQNDVMDEQPTLQVKDTIAYEHEAVAAAAEEVIATAAEDLEAIAREDAAGEAAA